MLNSLRIMLVGFDLNPPFQPTAARVCFELAKNLAEKGSKVSILTDGPNHLRDTFINGVKIIQTPLKFWRSKKEMILRIIRKENPQIVNGIGGLFSMSYLTRLFRKCDFPFLFTLTTGGFPSFGIRKNFRSAIEFAIDMGNKETLTVLSTLFWSDTVMSKANTQYNLKGIIVPTYRLKSFIANHLKGTILESQIYHIPFGVDTNRFSPKGREKSSSGNFSIFYYGHAFRHRGFDTLIKAVRLVSKRIPQVDLNVFTPSQPTVDIPKDITTNIHVGIFNKIDQTINEAAVAAFPFHYTIPELPLTVLESMSASKAVVSTNILGLSEVVRGGYNGFVVKPYQVAELANSITRILLDDALRRKLGNTARKSILHLDWNIVTARLLNIYKQFFEY
jgi:glycosyltransferase involved in cell wall biosynthesis